MTLRELLEQWEQRARSLDDKVGRAAALHNIREYAVLIGQRQAIKLCIKELTAVAKGEKS
jgi:hypothetical protein